MSVMKAVHDSPDLLAAHVDELRAEIRQRDPLTLAERTGASYEEREPGQGIFRLPLWGREVELPFPLLAAQDEAGRPLGSLDQAMLAYYFHTADGSPLAGEWIGFSELPDGRFYTQAFQGYTGHKLAKAFGNDIDAFVKAAGDLGRPLAGLGDAAFIFPVLPQAALLAAAWAGDEDFPPSYRVLFDANISHQLPTDGCAILGSILTRRLIKAQEV